jgi:hypothetical protein
LPAWPPSLQHPCPAPPLPINAFFRKLRRSPQQGAPPWPTRPFPL